MPQEMPEDHLCRCCHSEGAYKSLYSSTCWLDNEEVMFYNVLRECFDIELAPVTLAAQPKLCGLCERCARQLQDALHLKRQVHKCEKLFRDAYSSYIGEQPIFEVKVKQEVEVDVKDVLSTTYLSQPTEPVVLKTDKHLRDDFDDDDGYNDPDDDIDYKPSEDEKEPALEVKDEPEETERKSKRLAGKEADADTLKEVEVPAKRKRGAASTAKVKKKRGRRSKKNADSTDDEELDNIDGVSVIIVKTKRSRRNVDFAVTDDGYQCLRCPTVEKVFYKLRSHMGAVHYKTGKYKCPTCNDTFDMLAKLVKHKFEEHDQDQRYKCNACDKAFYAKLELSRHIDSFHMLGEKLKCDKCEFETYSKRGFHNHKVIHSTVKKHVCKFCKKAFKVKYGLDMHERIHTGDKRKVCGECGDAFIDRTSLKYHMTRRHPDVNF